jgi:hypothetical protein
VKQTTQRRLLLRADVMAVLQLPEPKVQWLLDTHQLHALFLCEGEERIDSREVDQLIETYKQIAVRKDPCVE